MHIQRRVIYSPSKKSEGKMEGNMAGSGVYSPNNNTQISERLPGYQYILRAKLDAIFIAIKTIQTTQTDTHIFRNNLNSIYLINNHVQHPTSQHHHHDKFLIATIIQKKWTLHLIHIHKVRAHTGIMGNEIADTQANKGTFKDKTSPTPHIHIAHTTPYWLASCPTATSDGAMRYLHKFITKEHDSREVRVAQNKFPYVDEWLSKK